MPLKIAQLGQPVLRQVAEPVPPADIEKREFQQFVDAMAETMRESNGVGLAAPQVFSSRRLFLAAVLPSATEGRREQVEVFVNPKITPISEEQVSGWEGCLSFIELLVLVPRARHVRVEYLDRTGKPKTLELSGWLARVVQHENDHLDGVLTIDRAATTRDIVKASEIDAVRGHSHEDDEDDD